MSGKMSHLGAGFAAFSMVLGSTAHAAPSAFTPADPLVSLSVFGTSSSRAAVCAAGIAAAGPASTAGALSVGSTTTAATTTQPAPASGCVLPVLGGAAPPPVVGVVPPVEPVVGGGGLFGGFGSLLPLFAIVGLTALAVAYLENKDDKGPPPISPF